MKRYQCMTTSKLSKNNKNKINNKTNKKLFYADTKNYFRTNPKNDNDPIF